MSFKIGNRSVGLNHPPFIIAEMSGNHNQSLERALQIVDAAASAGAQPDSRTAPARRTER